MDAISPSIPKCFHLLGFSSDLIDNAIFDGAASGAPLKIAVELDAVRRIDVDALHLTAQSLPLGEASHDLQRITENYAIRPILIVLVEVGFVRLFRSAVEIHKQVELWRTPGTVLALFGFA